MKRCSFTTFSGQPCQRPATEQTPTGAGWCGVPHERGTKKESGGQNGPCSCGSDVKHKNCCAALPADAEPNIMKKASGAAKVTKKTVWSVGYNIRRWVVGYERDAQWRANIIYIGPFFITRRPK